MEVQAMEESVTSYANRLCHALTHAWEKKGGATLDWDSLTCFLDIGGPIS